MRLGSAALGNLPAGVAPPAYQPRQHAVGIVHLGVGAFHRAHQAAFIDTVLGTQGGDWRILGVSLRSASVRDRLADQDNLYTLVERGRMEEQRVIGALAGMIVAPEEPEAVLEALSSPATHIVTLTITEKGYCHAPATGRLDLDHADIVHDLASPDQPRGAPGYLVEGLARRRARGLAAPVLLSCDNLPTNGALLRQVLIDLAAARDPGLADWIDAHVPCPSSMVDRIVPATTEADLVSLERELGYQDSAAVFTERFSQWVLEDGFTGPRPDLAAAGVQLVSDVRPFELAKLRMLNASHSLLAYLGALAGYSYVHEAIADPGLAALVRRLMLDEAAPTLPPAHGLDPAKYASALIDRFGNPALNHRLHPIAMDGSQKLPQRLLGTTRDNLQAGRPFDIAALAVAAWMRFALGRSESGQAIQVDDPLRDSFASIAARAHGAEAIADGFLGLQQVFGHLGQAQPFRASVTRHLAALLERGAARVIAEVAGTSR